MSCYSYCLNHCVGLAAKNGILIKDDQTLEVSEKTAHVLLGKTGTITIGQPVLSNIINYSKMDGNKVLKIARSIEQFSQYPIFSVLFNNKEKEEFKLYDITDFENISGKGVKGKNNNQYYFMGNRKLIKEHSINLLKKLLKG